MTICNSNSLIEGFQMMEKSKAIPNGWRLASLDDVTEYREKAHEAFSLLWAICRLEDGKIAGPGYNYDTEKGYFPDLGHKLIINSVLDTSSELEKYLIEK